MPQPQVRLHFGPIESEVLPLPPLAEDASSAPSPAVPGGTRRRSPARGAGIPAAPRGERRCLGESTHLVDLAEGSVSQLPHDLPHLAGIQVSPNVLVLLGTPFLKGGKAQDAAEISESHAAGSAALPPPRRRQLPAAAPRSAPGQHGAARSRARGAGAAPPAGLPACRPPVPLAGTRPARLGSARRCRAVLRCRAGPRWAAAGRAGAESAVGTRLGAGPHAVVGRTSSPSEKPL